MLLEPKSLLLKKQSSSLVFHNYRYMEALSTCSMLFAYVWSKPCHWNLFLAYFMNCIVSMWFHLSGYSSILYRWDKSLIELLVCERVHQKNKWLGYVFHFNVLVFNHHKKNPFFFRTVVSMAVITVAILSFYNGDHWGKIFSYLFINVLCVVFSVLSDVSVYFEHWYLSALLTTYFNLFLGVAVDIENSMVPHEYPDDLSPISFSYKVDMILRFVVYFSTLFKMVEAYILLSENIPQRFHNHNYENPTDPIIISLRSRLARLCTFITSFLLSFIGLYELFLASSTMTTASVTIPTHPVDPRIHRIYAMCFYVAYTVYDSYLGMTRFQEHFRLLDGKLHHLCTGGLTLYCLYVNDLAPLCQCYLCEIPTVMLSGSRLFPGSFLAQWKERYFSVVFIVFRVVLLFVFALYEFCQSRLHVWYWLPFSLFTVLNLFWWVKMK